MRAGRQTLGIGLGFGFVFVLAVLAPAVSCSSSPGPAATAGKGGTVGDAGASGTPGTAGQAGTLGTAGQAGSIDTGLGGGGAGGTTGGAGGTTGGAGTGGAGTTCSPSGAGGSRTLCGPAPTCDGNSVATLAYCDQGACSGPSVVVSKTACPAGVTCGGGRCLTHGTPPVKTCSVPTDCGLPPTVCIGTTEQLIFSDPSCDAGQCHWKQIVDTCGSFESTNFLCMAGTCYDPGMLTRGPVTPTPSPDPMQPPAAPEHACTVTTDCPQPSPACFHDSLVTYVHGVCRAGACSWEVDLGQCAGTCADGACVAP